VTTPKIPSDSAAWRTDRYIALRKPRSNGAGGLILDAFISKPGVLLYKRADGSEVRELVTSETLHQTLSLDSVRLAPITVDHPDSGTVTAQNYERLAVGMVGERIDIAEDGRVRMTLNVASERGVKAIEGRLDGQRRREISAGYFVTIDETPGIHPEFGQYDRIQKDRMYNHIALVQAGRAGPSVHVRADEAHRTLDEGDDVDIKELKARLEDEQKAREALQIRLDAMDAEKSASIKADFDAMATRIDDLEAAMADALAEPSDEEKAEADKVAAQARLDDRLFRRRLDSLLPAAKIEAADADSLDTDALVEKLFGALDLTPINLDGVDETASRKAAVIFHLDAKPSRHPYEIDEAPQKRADSAPERNLDLAFDNLAPAEA
tara:strand:- start:2579 stop:3718 length:1140 start_codon:yes stop_codon:yes gene_type:complete